MKLLTLARDLKRRKSRERQGLFVAEGVRTVEELLDADLAVRGILAAPTLRGSDRGDALLERAFARSIPVLEVSEADFASAADTESPQGILAIAGTPSHSPDDVVAAEGSIVVLDALQDPGNVGTILRTAAAFGAAGVLALPGTVDLWNAKVVRSAMGALFRLPTAHVGSDRLGDLLASRAVPLWGADAGGDPLDADLAVPPRVAVALGNEGAGLSPMVRERSDRLVAIPISPGVESLNVAVAAGILLYALGTAHRAHRAHGA
ncbi:MAG TPA: RNA methyltransferase [Gemmatimonadales bacterium]